MSVPAVEMQRVFARTEELCGGTAAEASDSSSELRELFRRSRDLAIELMRDNEQLRVQNLLLEKQKIEAEQRFDHSRLGKENEQLKGELELLTTRLAELEKQSNKFRSRYEQIEQHNAALSNIYLASNQLHATLDFSEVVRTAEEILWNLIAAHSFAIFLRDEHTGALSLVGGQGVEGRFPDGCVRDPSGMMAEVLAEGVSLFIDGAVVGDPLACVPLKVEERTVGLIAIFEVEADKDGLSELDKELFDLLASRTATAMSSSRVYSDTVKKLKSMESFINLIKPA